MEETTSRHLRNASEVLLWIPIQDEFAQFDEQIMSYASRLRALLKTVFEFRRDSTERRGVDTAGPVERLQIVYNVQWTVLEAERRLLVAASFDRSWETYFRELADTTGALLDAIFCHCEGFEGHTCAGGFDAFMSWIRQYQRPCDFFFSAAPELTTDDFRYLKLLSRVAEPGVLAGKATTASRVFLEPPAKTAGHSEPENIERALWTLYELRKFFPKRVVLGPGKRSEQEVFDGATSALFLSEQTSLQEANRSLALQLEAAKLSASPIVPASLIAASIFDLTNLLSWSRTLSNQELERKRKLIESVENIDLEVLKTPQLESIQGGILTDYLPVTTHGVMALVQCDSRESFAAFLSLMSRLITTERESVQHDGSAGKLWVNLGLTYRGLERLGLPQSVLQQFPKEFREGMEARAGLLGDIGNQDYPLDTGPIAKAAAGPRVRMANVDAVVTIQRRCEELPRDKLSWWDTEANPFRAWLDALVRPGVRILAEQPLQRQFERDAIGAAYGNVAREKVDAKSEAVREHFGYVEGEKRSSQPVPRVAYEGHPNAGPAFAAAATRDSVRLGEILLGYANQRGEPSRTVELDGSELLQDGSFLVVRKLRQDVGAFRDFVAASAKRLGIEADELKTLLKGRDPNLVTPPSAAAKNPNDFHYDSDVEGIRCPHFSHTRRTNPRSKGEAAVIPRILRRGFSYGATCPDRKDPLVPVAEEADDRGLVFMAYNANIAEQFEVLQRWISGGNRTGMLSTQQDLLAGQGPISQAAYWLRSEDSSQDRQFAPPSKPLVTLHWGAYLFVPSKRALQTLARAAQSNTSAAAARGAEIIERLQAFERTNTPEAARAAWKKVLEEPISAEQAADVWQAVQSNHAGALRTAYGVLVASLDLAVRVLRDDGSTYSVREYGDRLGKLIGPHYLGIDRGEAEYVRLATDPNEFANTKIEAADAFELARSLAAAALRDAPLRDGRREAHVRRLAELVVLQLCHAWFELPLEPPRLDALVFTSRYAFQVSPGAWVESEVAARHAAIVAPRPASNLEAGDPRLALRDFVRQHERTQEGEIELALNGAIVGFAAPAIASIVSILDRWATEGDLWRLAAIARDANDLESFSQARTALLQPVLDALQHKPVPSLLYRKARKKVDAIAPGSPVTVEEDDTIIVGLGAVYADAIDKNVGDPEQWLFGGEYTGEKIEGPVLDPSAVRSAGTSHGCPARCAALAALLGVFSAVVSRQDLRLERRFVVSYAPNDAPLPASGE